PLARRVADGSHCFSHGGQTGTRAPVSSPVPRCGWSPGAPGPVSGRSRPAPDTPAISGRPRPAPPARGRLGRMASHSAPTTATRTAPVDLAALLPAAQERLPQMLADIERAISIETPSSDLDAVARGAQDFAALITERLGATPEVLTIDGVTHLRLRFGDGPPAVVLVNHQDTVWPHGTLDTIPFSHEDGVIRGPGSFDMLTGAVMSVHAAALLI